MEKSSCLLSTLLFHNKHYFVVILCVEELCEAYARFDFVLVCFTSEVLFLQSSEGYLLV